MLQPLGVPIEIDSLAVVQHVILLVEVVTRLLRQLVTQREHQIVLREAAFALSHSALNVDRLGRLVEGCHASVPLGHLFLVKIGMRLPERIAEAAIWLVVSLTTCLGIFEKPKVHF